MDAPAAVILSHTHDFEHPARRVTRIFGKIGGGLLLHQNSGDFAFLEDLVFEVIFAVVAKPGVESETEQTVWSALVEKFFAEIGEQEFRVSFGILLEAPDFPCLMDDEKRIGQARNLAKPDKP